MGDTVEFVWEGMHGVALVPGPGCPAVSRGPLLAQRRRVACTDMRRRCSPACSRSLSLRFAPLHMQWLMPACATPTPPPFHLNPQSFDGPDVTVVGPPSDGGTATFTFEEPGEYV